METKKLVFNFTLNVDIVQTDPQHSGNLEQKQETTRTKQTDPQLSATKEQRSMEMMEYSQHAPTVATATC